MLTPEQRRQLRRLRYDIVDEAPSGLDGERLIEGGFPNRQAAEQAMFNVYAPVLAEKYGNTERFGIKVKPMFQPVPGRRRVSGWGVFVRDRAVGHAGRAANPDAH